VRVAPSSASSDGGRVAIRLIVSGLARHANPRILGSRGCLGERLRQGAAGALLLEPVARSHRSAAAPISGDRFGQRDLLNGDAPIGAALAEAQLADDPTPDSGQRLHGMPDAVPVALR
jgi:hypothetical protein